MMVCKAMLFIILIVLSAYDIRTKMIPARVIALSGVVVLCDLTVRLLEAATFYEGVITLCIFALGAVPGLLMTVLSFLSDRVGRGDGIVIMIIGSMYDMSFAMMLICMACILLAVPSVILVITGKAHKNTHMPYIPFVAISYLIMILLTTNIGGICL